jgi:peptidoglycan glycosyltransferase
MNEPIARLFGLVVVLFALLVAWTSRWTVFDAPALRANTLNKRSALEEQRIPRGRILAADGTVLAYSTKRTTGPQRGTYTRHYPTHGLFGHAVGYDYPDIGRTGLEQFYDAALTDRHNGLRTVLDQLLGRRRVGQDLYTNLDPQAQRVAYQALGGHIGGVVALDPRTGRVRVMASTPTYNPSTVDVPAVFRHLNRDPLAPLVNRATQFGTAPGSTFKTVTSTAAIDTGKFTLDSRVSGKNGVVISGTPLSNDSNESYGDLDLVTALTKSVNTVFAQIAVAVGKPTMKRYMQRFGFDEKPKLDYPRDQMSASGEYRHNTILPPTSTYADIGRMGIGQDKLAVTPLQMALVASAIANDGVLMKPRLGNKIVDRDGRATKIIRPQVQKRVMSAKTANDITTMMVSVVQRGTGTKASIPGIQVAGKTGTAETQIGTQINDVWFIAFAPADHPRVAIAVMMKKVPGFGGDFAAPVAKSVMESLLR